MQIDETILFEPGGAFFSRGDRLKQVKSLAFFLILGLAFTLRGENPPAANPANPILPGGVMPAPGQPLADERTLRTSAVNWAYTGGHSAYFITDSIRALAVYHGTIAAGFRTLAEVRYREAQAAGELGVAQRYYVTNAILNDELSSLQRMEVQAEAQFRKENRLIQQVQEMKLGKTGPKQFSALGYFFAHILSPKRLKDLLSRKVPLLVGSETFEPAGSIPRVPDFPGGNLGELLLFMKANQLKLKEAGTAREAFEVLSTVLSELEESLKAEFDLRKNRQAAVRQSIFSAFQPK